MSKRMAQSGYGFVIAAAPAADGQVMMVASQTVCDITIGRDQDEIHRWGGQAVMAYMDTKITASLAAPSGGHDHMVTLSVEDGGYAEAWRRLFDIWVPPQFTDETKSQILTHYTFGGL